MKKLVKLPLSVNGVLCKSIEDLKENFNIYDLLEHFESGKLEVWLRSRKFDEQLAAIQEIDESLEKEEIAEKIYKIFSLEANRSELSNALMVLEYQDDFDSKNIERKKIEEIFNKYAQEIKFTYENKIQILEGKLEDSYKKIDTLPVLEGQRKIEHYLVSDSEGLVIDTKTNLMWKRFGLGQYISNGVLSGVQKKYMWATATKEVDKINGNGGYRGYMGWRIPSLDELLSLLRSFNGNVTPNINKEVFPSSPAKYWTSSDKDTGVYTVDFERNLRQITSKGLPVGIILVRDNKGK